MTEAPAQIEVFEEHEVRRIETADLAVGLRAKQQARSGEPADDTFVRMWHFYLEYSRAGFASGYIDDHQLTLAREGR